MVSKQFKSYNDYLNEVRERVEGKGYGYYVGIVKNPFIVVGLLWRLDALTKSNKPSNFIEGKLPKGFYRVVTDNLETLKEETEAQLKTLNL